MSEPCLELVVFKVKDAATARSARRMAQYKLSTYDGFVSWSAYESVEDTGMFADIVLWRDQASAQAANGKARRDPDLAPFMAEIDGIMAMSHFRSDRTFSVTRAMAAA